MFGTNSILGQARGAGGLVRSFRNTPTSTPEQHEAVRLESNYFQGHTERIRYAEFRLQDLFVGSVMFEASCRALFGTRLKRSEMFWTVKGANAIIALRCAQLSNGFDDYW